MARGYTTRKLEVWAIHAHQDDAPVDYSHLFRDLTRLDSSTRSHATAEKLVAIPRLQIERDLVRLVAYEGNVGQNPLIFNATDAAERIERLEAGEVVATKTHAVIDLTSREAIIEYNHRGAKAQDVALLLVNAARTTREWRGLNLEFNPIADREFVDAIDRFERVRVASMRITRPNVDWTDWKNEITGAAEDSDAQSVEVDFFAGRGNSLSRSRGAVAFIKRLVRERGSILKNAAITGTREGEGAETTISLGNYVAHQRVSLRMTDDGHVDEEDIDAKLNSFLAARRAQREDPERN